MATATLTPPAAPAAPPFDPVAFVRRLPPGAQEAVFLELVREVLRVDGRSGPLPVVTPEKEFLCVLLPPAAVDAQLAELNLDVDVAETQRILDAVSSNPAASVSFEEMLEWLKEAADDRYQPPSPPA